MSALGKTVRRCFVFGAVILSGLVLGSCGGGPAATSGLPPANPGTALTLDQAISEINSAPVPEGADPAVFSELQAELVRLLRQRGISRIASAPPIASDSQVGDLMLKGNATDGHSIIWSYVNPGDYDLDSEVNISDLTPIAIYFHAASGGPGWEEARSADGNSDGEVNLSDITPIAMNYYARVVGYRIYSSADFNDYPADPGGADGPGAAQVGQVLFTDGVPDEAGSVAFELPLPEAGKSYWVRPYDGTGTGLASRRLDMRVIMRDNTVVLDSETGAQLESISDTELVFTASTSQLAALQPDDVIVSGPLPNAPDGLLRKVVLISGSGPVTITVEYAALQDALSEAWFTQLIQLLPENVASATPLVSGVEWQPDHNPSGILGPEFFLSLTHVPVATGVELDGTLSVTPELILNLGMQMDNLTTSKVGSGLVLGHFDFGARARIYGGLTVTGDLSSSWDKELSLFEIHFTPIPILLGVFPLVLTPSIEVVVGAEGNASLQFEISASADAYVEGSIGIGLGGWGFQENYGANFYAPDPVINGSLYSKLYTGPRLYVKIYGFAGGTGLLAITHETNADVTKDPWWTMCGGVEGRLGWEDPIFSKEYEIFNECHTFLDSGGPFSPNTTPTNWGNVLDHDQAADYDIFNAVLPLADSGMVAAGKSLSNPLIARFGEDGGLVWQKILSSTGEFSGLCAANGGGIIAVGSSAGDGLAVKLDDSGNVVWSKLYGGPKSDRLHAVRPLQGGGYLAAGEYLTDASFGEAWLLKINSDGSMAGSKTWGLDGGDVFRSLAANPDGTLWVAGEGSTAGGSKSGWLALLNAGGEPQWHRSLTITGPQPIDSTEWITGVCPTGDSGCYLTGQTNRSSLSMWVAKAHGTSLDWLSLVDKGDFALTWDVAGVTTMADGSAAICGQTGTAGPQGQRDGFVVTLTSGGALGWACAYGGGDDDGFSAIAERQGAQGLFVGGLAQSFRSDNEQDAWALLVREGGLVDFIAGGDAGQTYLSGELSTDYTGHLTAFTPTAAEPSTTVTPLVSTTANFGATPVVLTE